MLKNNIKIAIIGGGVAGSTTAITLGELGMNVTLFEKESSLVSGPPFCHLHAGGNLYREISDEQCVTLLKQSIDFAKFYPFVVDHRPTVIALPTTDKASPQDLLPRLDLLVKEYEKLIEKDTKNQVLGESKNYYKLYEKEKLEELKKAQAPSIPTTSDEWMISLAQNLNLEKIKFPLILVQEYGLNLFRLASSAKLTLESLNSVKLNFETAVIDIKKASNQWQVTYEKDAQKQTETFDYLINSAGFRTGNIEDMLNIPCTRMVEFKAAYVSQWQEKKNTLFPEIIFHGERGTPQGMGQFTPYPNGYFQLHGMTTDITLYEDGLASNTAIKCQPQLKEKFLSKIEKAWSEKEIKERTHNAIEHLAQFIPSFKTATVGSKPLFGAQQIPGDDPSLRVAEISFPIANYARCEIVKVSSAIDMVEAIIKEFVKLDYLDASAIEQNIRQSLEDISEDALQAYAQELAKSRDYPSDLAHLNVKEQ